MRQRQVDFIDGKFKGFKLMSLSTDATKDYEKQLSTKRQVVKEVAQNLFLLSKRARRDRDFKLVDLDTVSKTGAEFLSGKKLSTTASRSPNSECDKKSCGELPKNMSDIRSYFIGMQEDKKMTPSQVFEIKREKKTSKSE